jgi:hypothetical protein
MESVLKSAFDHVTLASGVVVRLVAYRTIGYMHED